MFYVVYAEHPLSFLNGLDCWLYNFGNYNFFNSITIPFSCSSGPVRLQMLPGLREWSCDGLGNGSRKPQKPT